MAVLLETPGVVPRDVLADPDVPAQSRRDRRIPARRPLNRLLAAADRHPDGRVRLLDRARPDRHVLIGPELALEVEYLLGPGPADDLPGLVEAGARLRERDVVHLVL